MRVGLLWHSLSSGNLGVGALTTANISLISEAAKNMGLTIDFKVIGNVGEKRYEQLDFTVPVETVEFSMASFLCRPRSVWKAIKDCDVIFDIGEGDSFSDIYGIKRFTKLLIGQFIGHTHGVPYVMAPQTIGPFENIINKKLAFANLSKCKKIFSRDLLSQKHLVDNGLADKSNEIIDVAFALPFDVVPNRDLSPVRVGLNVSGLLYNGGYSGKNQFNLRFDYAEFIHELIESLISRNEIEIHLIPHVFSEKIPEEDDYKVSVDLAKKYASLKVPARFTSPIDAKNYIASMDFFSGARMHATIAAFSSGVPVVPIAYSRKFNGLYSSLKYPFVVDGLINTHKDALNAVLEGFDNRECLKTNVKKGNHIARERLALYRKCIEVILVEVNG